MKITAADYSDLVAQLAADHPHVNLRGKGRNKGQSEEWVSRRLIPTLAKLGRLAFPLAIDPSDRPDLRISSADAEIGIEVTEIVPQAFAEADAIANKCYPGAVVDRSLFRWGARFTPQQIHEHLSRSTGLTGPPWVGDSCEREWAAAANETIRTKTTKLNQHGFVHFSKNWLAAYASAPEPSLNLEHGSGFLDSPSAVGGPRTFDLVLLLTDTRMVLHDNIESRVVELELIPVGLSVAAIGNPGHK